MGESLTTNVEPYPVGTNEWWTVRRVANGDATRPWYELSNEDIEHLDHWRQALEQNQLFRRPDENPLEYQKALAVAHISSLPPTEPQVIEAAGRIMDWFSGGYAWRQRADLSSIYESADWAQAMNYARAALDPDHHAEQFSKWSETTSLGPQAPDHV